jgi:kinesin family protein 2/24
MSSENAKIFVLVRKRPLSKKELAGGEIDCISSINPKIFVHECKIKVDGITKYIEDYEFLFDNSFSDKESTEDVYRFSIYPTVNMILNKGIVTCFAYGQTGSGKTFTMVIFYLL